GYNRGLHGRPQAHTLTATIVQRLVDECPMSAMGSTSAVSGFLRHGCFTPRNRTLVGAAGTAEKCQEATYAVQQENASIRSPRRQARGACLEHRYQAPWRS